MVHLGGISWTVENKSINQSNRSINQSRHTSFAPTSVIYVPCANYEACRSGNTFVRHWGPRQRGGFISRQFSVATETANDKRQNTHAHTHTQRATNVPHLIPEPLARRVRVTHEVPSQASPPLRVRRHGAVHVSDRPDDARIELFLRKVQSREVGLK